MPLTRVQKQKIIEDLKEKLTRQKAVVFADITGLKVKNLSSLRKELKKQDCELKVVKKNLISLVFKDHGLNLDFKKMKGEIALGFGYKDEITPLRMLYNFSKDNENLKIIAGLIDEDFFEREEAIELAKLPSRELLLAQLFFTVKLPILALQNMLQRSLNILNQVVKI